jgi:hypothetical protein
MILPEAKGHDVSIMIWGAIFGEGRSDLILMERDPLSKREGYSANSYLSVLEDQMQRCFEPGLNFV